MKLLFAIAAVSLLSFSALAEREAAAPFLGTHKHAPVSVRRCSCREGTVKDSRVPLSTCPAAVHGRIQEFPIYNDLCRTVTMSERFEGPSETATSFLGPKEVIVGVSYGDQSFELSEDWIRAVPER